MDEGSSVVLGIRIPHDSFRRVELDPVNLACKVEDIKAAAVKETGLTSEQILLVYGGVALDDGNTLKHYGIKSGFMIHVLKKKEKDIPVPQKKISDKEIQQLVLAFRSFALNPGYRTTLNRLSRPEALEYMLTTIPGLRQDAVAYSILRDPELLVHMGDAATLRRVVEKHPVLAEAANHIAAVVHEESAAARSSRRSHSTYSPEAFSGEEMDSSQVPSPDSSPSTRSAASGITSSQLAAALAAAGGSAGSSGASSSRASGQDRAGLLGLITPEMFNTALQQAFQEISVPSGYSTPSPASNPSTPRTGFSETPFALAERMTQQLQQMRELGLRDQVFNLQALQITNGDVQAAIELVMSNGGNGRDDDEDDDSFRQN